MLLRSFTINHLQPKTTCCLPRQLGGHPDEVHKMKFGFNCLKISCFGLYVPPEGANSPAARHRDVSKRYLHP
jgi:hypothetical protein